MHTARWHFLRHGLSLANLDRRLEGRGDSRLAPEGEAHARALAPRVAALRPDRILCSPLHRARQTAALVAPTWPAEVLPALVERSLGAWEGLPRSELQASERGAVLLSWSERPPGGESQRDVALRALTALAALEPRPCTLVVSHAGVLRVLLGLIDGVPRARIGQLRVPHTELLTRSLPPHTWRTLRDPLLEDA